MSTSLLVVFFILTRAAVAEDAAPPLMQPIQDFPPAFDPPPPPQQDGASTVRIFNKANPSLSLTGLWNGKVVMTLGNGTMPYQQWFVDTSWGTRFTDAVGYKAFMLVNKATGMILRHGYLENSAVSCGIVKGDLVDSLWTRGPDLQGFHTIRACSKVELIMDVERADLKKHILLKEGCKVVMFKMSQEETQYWRMEAIVSSS
ncbi:ricin B-like lectin R40G3 [Selaginella moellendorffii]|uniref:ricin B-like lectin R40G3 n=1 Tax=Selaginella moellendorffii TaxID=88036 RepID=UPI000D1C9D05|nr:ricin B-like lectin R40G3 [Selaginella moellendorffii]|eukprot:XP_024545697.1 ricin B-like lectin R40G3 [Selaginella moellendorffii]